MALPRNRRARVCTEVVLCVAVAVLYYVAKPLSPEERQLEVRYIALVSELQSGDPRRADSVVSPDVPPGDQIIRSRLINFARPLQPGAKLNIDGDFATVTPEPLRHFPILSGGNTVQLRKSGGAWFFTGKVSID